MKVVKYKHHNLATNSHAYELLEAYRRSGKPEDQKKLEQHLKEVDKRYDELHGITKKVSAPK